MPREDWSYKNIENFYDRVRMALGDASEITLPDEYIDYPEKAPFAEQTLKIRVPGWADLDEVRFKIFESAVVYQTASMFESIISNKFVKKQQIPTITLEYGSSYRNDIDGMSLKDIVDYLVSQLLGEEVGSGYFGFRVTRGGCSKW